MSVSAPQRFFGVLLAVGGVLLAASTWTAPLAPGDGAVRDAVFGPVLIVAGLTCLFVPVVRLDGAPVGDPSVTAPEGRSARLRWAVSLVAGILAGLAHLWVLRMM